MSLEHFIPLGNFDSHRHYFYSFNVFFKKKFSLSCFHEYFLLGLKPSALAKSTWVIGVSSYVSDGNTLLTDSSLNFCPFCRRED